MSSTQPILGRKLYREGKVIEQYSVIGRKVVSLRQPQI